MSYPSRQSERLTTETWVVGAVMCTVGLPVALTLAGVGTLLGMGLAGKLPFQKYWDRSS